MKAKTTSKKHNTAPTKKTTKQKPPDTNPATRGRSRKIIDLGPHYPKAMAEHALEYCHENVVGHRVGDIFTWRQLTGNGPAFERRIMVGALVEILTNSQTPAPILAALKSGILEVYNTFETVDPTDPEYIRENFFDLMLDHENKQKMTSRKKGGKA